MTVKAASWILVLNDRKQPPYFLDTKFSTTENSVVGMLESYVYR